MAFINLNVKITKQEAKELLMIHKNHYLWHKQFSKWTVEDVDNIQSGRNKNPCLAQNLLSPKPQPVEVVFNDGKKEKFPSIGHLCEELQISQGALSNIIAGRRGTKRFKSINKI